MTIRCFSLTDTEKNKIVVQLRAQLDSKEEIVFAYLYGSFLTGQPFKDIDMAIYVDSQKISGERALGYELDLSGCTEYEIGYPIDIKILNYAPLSFQMRVLKTGHVLKDQPHFRTLYIEEVSSKYFDYVFFKKSYESEIEQIIKEHNYGLPG